MTANPKSAVILFLEKMKQEVFVGVTTTHKMEKSLPTIEGRC